MRSRTRTLTLGLATVVSLAGCSGSDDATPTTTSDPVVVSTTASVTPTSVSPSNTSATTSVSSTSTTVLPPATTPSVSTTTPTTPRPTTAAPETAAEVDQQVRDALVAAREAYLYAVYNLDAEDALDRLEATHAAASPSLELALENVQTLVDNGWLARPNPDVPDTVTVEDGVTMVNDTTAEVVACVVGAGVVYNPGGAADGSDLIVNGEIEAALNRVTMVIEGGRWKLREGANLNTQEGTECAPE